MVAVEAKRPVQRERTSFYVKGLDYVTPVLKTLTLIILQTSFEGSAVYGLI